ncbi:MAG TPA: transaldolase [Planctomycetes bacterium]|nr:transaldolase [Fuerstiella sp.]HIK91634.1 transaldolase [Planctomycetota bacterium]
MSSALRSLIDTGTKLWLDSIDPDLITENKHLGATGATSNPIIIANLLKTGRFDDVIDELIANGLSADEIAWDLTDRLVRSAQQEFLSVWEATSGNDGYVSFELDPLLEDQDISHAQRVDRYVELGKEWAQGHKNRMVKVPATPAGLDSLEELCAAGVTLNVTLIFTEQQYVQARDAIWRGAQRRDTLNGFKSVYSIFVSRIDVYTAQHIPELSPAAAGQVGIVNAQRIWQKNLDFWADKNLPLQQEIIFASTGTKNPEDAPWKYVAALAGSDIQTNPPATNQAIAESSETFARQVAVSASEELQQEIDQHVDFGKMQEVLMEEGVEKFVSPQKSLLELMRTKCAAGSQG